MSDPIPNPLDPSVLGGGSSRFLAVLLGSLAATVELAADADDARDAKDAAAWEAGAEERASHQHARDVLDRLNDLGIVLQTARALGDGGCVEECERLAKPLLAMLLADWCERTEAALNADIDGDGSVAEEAEEVDPADAGNGA